ncbi:helix-turn-helix transcriptional regulator [Cohnella nanjingensis]|uniref:YafY family transcriptional regulator n=1 Tax=Cohnella nanjingensis TaxID=1387779 RepID=A0A7X0RZ32_9BACL|nr:YafY family protein [Cohnella nanjingensis]MBB6675121.1 YafY family transcriptional regulator [Cohnella nanjingensis]
MKLERLISITYALLNQEVVSATELAEKYQVSPRTIYRDIEAIGAAGIPVVSYQGVNGGFGIIKEYKMDRSLLGADDVNSLITLLHSTATVFKDDRAEDTLHRLRTVQPVERIPSLNLDLGSWRMNNALLHELRTAITDRRVVRFGYINAKNAHVERVVEPFNLQFKYYSWYLHGYCRTREDYRVFKLSRMTNLMTTEEEVCRSHAPPAMNVGADLRRGRDMTGAVIRFDASAVATALDCFYAEERRFDEAGSLTIRIVNPTDVDWLVSTVLSFGGDAYVEEPAWMRQEIRDKIEKLRARYEEV